MSFSECFDTVTDSSEEKVPHKIELVEGGPDAAPGAAFCATPMSQWRASPRDATGDRVDLAGAAADLAVSLLRPQCSSWVSKYGRKRGALDVLLDIGRGQGRKLYQSLVPAPIQKQTQ